MRIIFLNTWGGECVVPFTEFLIQHRDTTDVFCFQEVTPACRALCTTHLSDFEEVYVEKLQGNTADVQQATFIRAGVQMLSHEPLLVDEVDAGLALVTYVEDKEGKWCVVNFHGYPYPGDKKDTSSRRAASQTLIDYGRKESLPVIVGGDFNLFPDTESIRSFSREGYRDLIAEYKIPTTRNDYAWRNYPGNKQLFADYVFVRGEVSVDHFSVPDINVSDHLPLILDVSMKKNV